MSDSPSFYPISSKCQASPPQASLHTCEPSGTSSQQMAESQTKEGGDVCFTQPESSGLRPAAVSRRHSADAALDSGSRSASERGPFDSDRFHPYHQQFSRAAATSRRCLQQSSSSFSCLEELQSSHPELPAVPGEPSCFLSQSFPSYSSASPLHQVSTRLYSNNSPSSSSKYSSQSQHQESSSQHLFPKPIYSYSILIFMALRNSKTGSLPVSEIYSFMTEHFPYFKTAPDGWKNSVRHNLSLNKCFVKVENKNGSSSRKGCLWALNPAKVEKMQDEVHKWRRKDPLAVRRSMARPEYLERLIGERPEKLRPLSSYSRAAPVYSPTSSSCAPAQLQPPCLTNRRPQYGYIQAQQPCYLPPAAAHPSNSFAQYSLCGQPTATGSLNSPTAGMMPPVSNGALQAECRLGPRSMQDLLLEVDTSYDIDALNPSLMDLQLQGSLWEELRDDSLISEPHGTTPAPFTTCALQDHHVQTGCLQATPPPICRRKAGYEDDITDSGRAVEQHGCLNGLHPVVYSGMESLAGYLTSCTTPISLV